MSDVAEAQSGVPETIDNRRPRKPGQKRRSSPGPARVLQNARKAAGRAPIGRPQEYHPELCQHAIRLGMKGHTWAGIASAFGISRKTLNEWEGQFPDFSDALARARVAAQAYLEQHGRSNLKADRYQAQVWAKLISVHEDYREQRTGNADGFDLGALVTSIAQGAAAAGLSARPGDGAKVIEAEPVKDDATPKR